MKGIAVIGAGRLGTALGRALVRSGYPVAGIADVSRRAARALGRSLPGARVWASNAEAAARARAIFLCVPDAEIAPAARELAASVTDWRGRVVVHCSGMLDARVLSPLRRRGALTASAHPIQSFARGAGATDPFRGITITLEGDDRAAAWLKTVVRRLGARPVRLRAGVKPLYHAACVLASNDLVFLLDMSQGLLVRAGFSAREAARMIIPLAQGTLHNVNKIGTTAALTGPLVRGDRETVARHLDALRPSPLPREVYRRLALQGLDIVRKTGLKPAKVRALKRLLEDRRPPLPAHNRTFRGRTS